MRSLRRGWASPPLQGQALGRLKKWVRFASIFSLSWLPPCPLRWDSEDASLSFSPPSGQPTAYPIMEIKQNINFFDFLRIKIIL